MGRYELARYMTVNLNCTLSLYKTSISAVCILMKKARDLRSINIDLIRLTEFVFGNELSNPSWKSGASFGRCLRLMKSAE